MRARVYIMPDDAEHMDGSYPNPQQAIRSASHGHPTLSTGNSSSLPTLPTDHTEGVADARSTIALKRNLHDQFPSTDVLEDANS
jgi:hypothetical protein